MKIEGYFSSIKAANETASRLKNEGFKEAYVDMNEHMNDAYSKRGLVGSEDIPSLSDAVFGESNIRGEDIDSPLSAASPMASGMAGFEEIADINCRVIVDTDQSGRKNAENIIRSMGGTMNSPNVKIPKGLENISDDAVELKNLHH